MTIGQRLKMLRNQIGLSQKAMGAPGFISAQGWIKIEQGQRSPSDKLLMELMSWLLEDEYFTLTAAEDLLEELLTLKYLGSRSPFLRKLARARAKNVFTEPAVRMRDMSQVHSQTQNDRVPRPRTREKRSSSKTI